MPWLEAEVEWFYEDLQELWELKPPQKYPFHYRGLECKSRKSRNTWSNKQIWLWNTEWSRAKANKSFAKRTYWSWQTPSSNNTREDSTHGHHQMVKTEITSVHSLRCVQLCATPWATAHEASLSITNSKGFTQTHVHWVSDAIQPSYILLSPSPPTFNLSQHQGLFKWFSSSYQVAKVLEFQLQHQSFQWIFSMDFL